MIIESANLIHLEGVLLAAGLDRNSWKCIIKMYNLKKKGFPEALELVFNLGLSVSLPIVIGALLGKWLDQKTLAYPRWSLSFLFLGIFIGGISFYQEIKKWGKK